MMCLSMEITPNSVCLNPDLLCQLQRLRLTTSLTFFFGCVGSLLGLAVSSLWHGILRVVRAGFSNVGEWSLVASAVCGILVFPLGIEPAPPALGHQGSPSLTF